MSFFGTFIEGLNHDISKISKDTYNPKMFRTTYRVIIEIKIVEARFKVLAESGTTLSSRIHLDVGRNESNTNYNTTMDEKIGKY